MTIRIKVSPRAWPWILASIRWRALHLEWLISPASMRDRSCLATNRSGSSRNREVRGSVSVADPKVSWTKCAMQVGRKATRCCGTVMMPRISGLKMIRRLVEGHHRWLRQIIWYVRKCATSIWEALTTHLVTCFMLTRRIKTDLADHPQWPPWSQAHWRICTTSEPRDHWASALSRLSHRTTWGYSHQASRSYLDRATSSSKPRRIRNVRTRKLESR